MKQLGLTSHWASFQELSTTELYGLLKLRVDVFVVEQKCAYPELDDMDGDAEHLIIRNGNHVVAGLRILPPVGSGPAKLGRIVVHPDYRNRGIGKILFADGLEKCRKLFPEREIQLSAQVQAKEFYGQFGFETVSKPYLDYGIEHIDMLLHVKG